jgi:hypothetical protein
MMRLARPTDAKAEADAERPEAAGAAGPRSVEVGGRGGYGRMGTCGRRPRAGGRPSDGRCGGGAVGGEASPSTGWREVAEQMAASEGVGHR